jgi:hypothetical protein
MNVSIPSDRVGVAGWWSGEAHVRAHNRDALALRALSSLMPCQPTANDR